MLNKVILFISFLTFSTVGYCQTASEVLQQMGKEYSSAKPLQYNSSYSLYKSAESKKIEQAYKGVFYKNCLLYTSDAADDQMNVWGGGGGG